MYQFLCEHIFSILGYKTTSQISGSYDNPMFNILENCSTVLQSGYIILVKHFILKVKLLLELFCSSYNP